MLHQLTPKPLITFVSLSFVITPVRAQEYGVNENWMTMGKTNDGAILFLDINSIQTKPNAGNWLWFSYRITDEVTTRERIGFTGACNKGKIVSKPFWHVELINENGEIDRRIDIEADSPASLKLLKTVCSTGYR
jgi:hypothetical protein